MVSSSSFLALSSLLSAQAAEFKSYQPERYIYKKTAGGFGGEELTDMCQKIRKMKEEVKRRPPPASSSSSTTMETPKENAIEDRTRGI
jgi:hypothetical protein